MGLRRRLAAAVVAVVVALATACGARPPSEPVAVDPAPVAAERSTTTAQATTSTTTTRREPSTSSQVPTTTSTSRLAESVQWVVGFHRWPGLEPGDTYLGETVLKAHKGLRAVVIQSDDPTFKRRAERQRNVRYVERNRKLKFDDFVRLPHHDYRPGDAVPAGPRWSVQDAGVVRGKNGCVWLLDDNDERHNVLWPKAFTMRYGEPLTIYNERNRPVWKNGQRFDIEALADRGTEHWQRVPRQCRLGDPDKDQPDEPIALILRDELE